MRRNVLLGILVVVLLGVLYFYTNSSVYTESGILARQLKFEQSRWLEGDKRTWGAMAQDIIASDTLMNLKRQQIFEVLGNPSHDYDTLIIYSVDMGHSMSSTNEPWIYDLRISLDSMNNVRRVGLSD